MFSTQKYWKILPWVDHLELECGIGAATAVTVITSMSRYAESLLWKQDTLRQGETDKLDANARVCFFCVI